MTSVGLGKLKNLNKEAPSKLTFKTTLKSLEAKYLKAGVKGRVRAARNRGKFPERCI